MSDPETLKVYAEQAAEYARLTTEANSRDPLLAAFIATLPKGGHVLDLGCGPGDAAAVMARAGLRVTALDVVPEMVTMAARHAGVDARLGGFHDIPGPAVFDGIWANFSLLHAPRADLPGHLAAIVHALRPGGLFHIALKRGTGSKRDRIGRLYTYYEATELTALLKDAGLNVTGQNAGRGTGLDGSEADWIALTAHA